MLYPLSYWGMKKVADHPLGIRNHNGVILSNFCDTVKTIRLKLIFEGNFKFPLYRNYGFVYNKVDYVNFAK